MILVLLIVLSAVAVLIWCIQGVVNKYYGKQLYEAYKRLSKQVDEAEKELKLNKN